MASRIAVCCCIKLGAESLKSSRVGESLVIGHCDCVNGGRGHGSNTNSGMAPDDDDDDHGIQFIPRHSCDASEMRSHVSNDPVDPRRSLPHIQKDFSTLAITGNRLPLQRLCSKSVKIHWIYSRLASVTKCIRSNDFQAAVLESKPAPG